MKISLRTKLSFAFIALALSLIVLISIMANMLLERQFTVYIVNRLERKNADIVSLVQESYKEWGSEWDEDGMHYVGSNALLDGLILRFSDPEGKVLWDARAHNDGMCSSILEHMALNMQEHTPGFQGGYTEKEFPIMNGDRKVGALAIGYYGPYFFSDHDLEFLGTLNRFLGVTAIVASLACLLLGDLIGRRISRPITEMIATTEQIAAGNFSDRTRSQTNTAEIVDLTDAINRMAGSLENQEQIRRRLTSDVAHELRTPIATLQSHLEAMIDGIWPADTARLQSCHEETARLTRLVGDLELLTRFENGSPPLTMGRFDLDELIRHLMRNFENDFRLKQIAFHYQGGETWIEGDRDKLSQVLVNLLANALKYTDAGGSVRVGLTSSEDRVNITVQDSGIGIAESDLPHIFDRFYRTDQSRNRQTGGSGIGLTIARAIVRAHQGTLSVSSTPDVGSTFTVSLPRKPVGNH